jgi:hypothetical protein
MTNPTFTAEQLLALAFLVGCTFAPNLKTFAGRYPLFVHLKGALTTLLYEAMRCLTAFFGFVDGLHSNYNKGELMGFVSTQNVPPGDGMKLFFKSVYGMA